MSDPGVGKRVRQELGTEWSQMLQTDTGQQVPFLVLALRSTEVVSL